MILSPFQKVFMTTYENLIDLWLESGELDDCVITIDVAYLELPTQEWVNVINNNIHFYKGQVLNISASMKSEEIFGMTRDTLIVKLTEIPIVYSDELKA